jgi:hypothetical protein
MSASARAKSSAHRPPKQKPITAMRFESTMGMPCAVDSPASSRRRSLRRSSMRGVINAEHSSGVLPRKPLP